MKFLVQLAFCCLLGLGLADQPTYQVENLDSSSGLLYDYLTKVVFANGDWKLVVHADTSELARKVNLMRDSYNILKALCAVKDCPSFERMNFLYGSVLSKADTYDKMTASSADNVAHQISGMPRNDMAIQMVEQVKKHDHDEIVPKDRVTFLKAAISYYNTDSKMQKTQEYYEKNVQLYNDIKNQQEKIKTDKDVDRDINYHIQSLSLLSLDMEKEYSYLVEALYYGQNKVLHPEIIKPETLLAELLKSNPHVSKPSMYPYPLTPENVHNILHLISLDIFRLKNKLVFVISVPLVEDTVYNLYNLLPLPVQSSEGTFVFIQPGSDNIAVSENKKKYAVMDVLRYCSHLNHKMMMCKPEPVYSMIERPICETELMSEKNTIPSSCNTRVVRNNMDVWYKMKSRNAWVFVKSKPEDMTVECKNGNPTHVKISKTGIFTIGDGCRGNSKGQILESWGPSSKNPNDITPSVSITGDRCCSKEIIENTYYHIKPSTLKVSNTNLYNIGKISKKIRNKEE